MKVMKIKIYRDPKHLCWVAFSIDPEGNSKYETYYDIQDTWETAMKNAYSFLIECARREGLSI